MMGLLVTIVLSMSRLTPTQVKIAGLGSLSQRAFYAADSGVECARSFDERLDAFATTSATQIQCDGNPVTVGGAADIVSCPEDIQTGPGQCALSSFSYSLTADSPDTTVLVEVYKPLNDRLSYVRSSGRAGSGDRRVERTLVTQYVPLVRCFQPDPAGRGPFETVAAPPPSDPLDLQQMLAMVGLNVDVNDPRRQLNYQRWTAGGTANPNSTARLSARYVNLAGGARNIFGYYTLGDPRTFVEVFDNDALPQQTEVQFDVPANVEIRFAIFSSYQGNESFWSTDPIHNLHNGQPTDIGRTHVLVFSRPDTDDQYLAFEDLPRLGDSDFNDFVVQVRVAGCPDG